MAFCCWYRVCVVFAVEAPTGRLLTCWFAGASAVEHNSKKPKKKKGSDGAVKGMQKVYVLP